MARIAVAGIEQPVTFVCVHLGLMQRSRNVQIEQLIEFLDESAPGKAPLIVAGDFNDWRGVRSGVSNRLAAALGVVEAFEHTHGKPARTFPAILPMLTLDRIYVRGFEVVEARRLHGDVDGAHWRGLSDHAGLAVRLRPQ
jgi:endonuclease/exonuclease/phosphatase family metal-dependent hydrolase